jgi:hypothetical protein
MCLFAFAAPFMIPMDQFFSPMGFLIPIMLIPTQSFDLFREGIHSGENTIFLLTCLAGRLMKQTLKWKQPALLSSAWPGVLDDCRVKVTYALSPQAKGKIERPYGWLQDRLIRTCVRENVTDIGQAHGILDQELYLSATGRSV